MKHPTGHLHVLARKQFLRNIVGADVDACKSVLKSVFCSFVSKRKPCNALFTGDAARERGLTDKMTFLNHELNHFIHACALEKKNNDLEHKSNRTPKNMRHTQPGPDRNVFDNHPLSSVIEFMFCWLWYLVNRI